MATRKIKDAKDLSTNELIYFKGHAKATYMSDGRTVEDAINTSGGGIETEIDPIFSASPAASITNNKIAEWDNKADSASLAKVATSGSYNDLSNKPTIPSAVTETTISDWGFTKNTGTYSKPSGGIPKTDLESAVQTSLGKADTALQSYDEQYKGTITEVKANGTSVATSGVANIPAASTSAYGVTKLSDATNSTSTVLAATANAVKKAYDLANSKTANTGTITEVKMNGASKGTSGSVDLGKVVTQIKFNGTTFDPTNGLLNLGTLPGKGEQKEVILVLSDGVINTMHPDAIYIYNGESNQLIINGCGVTANMVDEYTVYFYVPLGSSMIIDILVDGELLAPHDFSGWTLESGSYYELSIIRTNHDGDEIYKTVLTRFIQL